MRREMQLKAGGGGVGADDMNRPMASCFSRIFSFSPAINRLVDSVGVSAVSISFPDFRDCQSSHFVCSRHSYWSRNIMYAPEKRKQARLLTDHLINE